MSRLPAPEIRLARAEDMPAVSEIYNYFVRISTATFQIEPESLTDRLQWFHARSNHEPVTVLRVEDDLVAWGALSRHRSREGYRQTAETSVYVRHDCHRRGHGRAILADLIKRARTLDYHTLLASCCSEAQPSIALHEESGFRQVGCFREVGRKFDRWLDVIYLQLIL
jgi:L-amino acid N-acyltransferase YncA